MYNPQALVNSPIQQQNVYPHRSISHYELQNFPKSRVTNENLNISSNHNSRMRAHSFQQNHHADNLVETIMRKRQQKIMKYRQQNIQKCDNSFTNNNKITYKQSNGIMNQPPDYIRNKYTFKNDEQQIRRGDNGDCLMFDSCCSVIKESQREVYLSPSQLITMKYFVPVDKQQAKSLRYISNKSNVGSVSGQQQKSFFKDNSNF